MTKSLAAREVLPDLLQKIRNHLLNSCDAAEATLIVTEIDAALAASASEQPTCDFLDKVRTMEGGEPFGYWHEDECEFYPKADGNEYCGDGCVPLYRHPPGEPVAWMTSSAESVITNRYKVIVGAQEDLSFFDVPLCRAPPAAAMPLIERHADILKTQFAEAARDEPDPYMRCYNEGVYNGMIVMCSCVDNPVKGYPMFTRHEVALPDYLTKLSHMQGAAAQAEPAREGGETPRSDRGLIVGLFDVDDKIVRPKGRFILQDLGRKLERELAAALRERDEAQGEIKQIVDYIMGYWPQAYCFSNPLQAVTVLADEMARTQKRAELAEAELEAARSACLKEGIRSGELESRLKAVLAEVKQHKATIKQQSRQHLEWRSSKFEFLLDQLRQQGLILKAYEYVLENVSGDLGWNLRKSVSDKKEAMRRPSLPIVLNEGWSK